MKLWTFWEGPMPGYVELCLETAKKHNPDIQILNMESFRDLQTFDKDVDLSHLCLAHQADWIRLHLLYAYGGVWMDADCVVMRNLQRFVDAASCCWFMSPLENDTTIGGGFIGAPPKSYLITKIYNRATDIVRRKLKPRWRGLCGELIEEVLKEHSNQGFFCIDWHQIQPLQWKQIRQDSWNIAEDEDHERRFNDKAFTYMMVHNKMPEVRKRLTRDEIINGKYFISYLYRRSMR